MCFRGAESVIFRSVGPIMIEITCDLFYSQTPPLKRVAITVFHDDFCSTHNTLMKNFRKRSADFKKMLKIFDCFQIVHLNFCHFCFPQRGFFSLPEGQYFIEPIQNSSHDAAEAPEPHIIYPRVTETHREKRDVVPGATPGPCGVQGMCAWMCLTLQMFG